MLDFSLFSSPPTETFEQIARYILSYAHLYELGTSLLILFLFLALKDIFRKYIFICLRILCRNLTGKMPDHILKSFRQPLNNLIVLLAIYLSLENYLRADFHPFLDKAFSTGAILFVVMGLYDLIGLFIESPDEVHLLFNSEVDNILVPFFSKILRLIIIAMFLIIILSKWGYDVNGFIAGLGLGGLAFAMAAKDLLSNIFSGIVIITDKPFGIGDWIKAGEAEGRVEDITFRCTKIRGFDMSLVIIPNSDLINTPITNNSRRQIRRSRFNLLVKYGTQSDKLERCVDKIKKMLNEHPHIDKQNGIFVGVETFADSGYQLILNFFTDSNDLGPHLETMQEVNFKIAQILAAEEVEIALPSSNIYVQSILDNRQ